MRMRMRINGCARACQLTDRAAYIVPSLKFKGHAFRRVSQWCSSSARIWYIMMVWAVAEATCEGAIVCSHDTVPQFGLLSSAFHCMHNFICSHVTAFRSTRFRYHLSS